MITGLADRLGAQVHFPFGAEPAPFLTWAMASDRAWVSPVGMLVQAEAGLMVSYRGALEFNWHIETPDAPPCSCTGCAKPCTTACPVGAYRALNTMLRPADPMCGLIQHNAASRAAVWPGALVRLVKTMRATWDNRPITCGSF